MARPIVGITMGDAAGVGHEIIMKSFAVAEVHEICRPLVIGDAGRLRKAGRVVGSSLAVKALREPAEARYQHGEVDCIDLALLPDDLPFGKLSAKAGDAAYRFVARAVELAMAGMKRPRIGVCGINPHAGEHGLFGRGEEEEKVIPAVEAAQARGIDVEGPLPADTLFFRAGRGDFDLVVAMYHDQGHGPVKVMGLEAGVNITVGLPFVRTSVDHGTAFDIAGTGKADERSLVEALRQAVALAPAASH